MIDRSTVFMVGASIIALLVVLELVRRRHLSEQYSLLWLGTALVMLVVGAWRDLLHSLAALVNIHHPPNLLFLLAALFSAIHSAIFFHGDHAARTRKQRSGSADSVIAPRTVTIARRADW